MILGGDLVDDSLSSLSCDIEWKSFWCFACPMFSVNVIQHYPLFTDITTLCCMYFNTRQYIDCVYFCKNAFFVYDMSMHIVVLYQFSW